jgi:CRISPR-associated protein (TIGR02584 family)
MARAASLVFVAGASPQIVTETVYDLLREPLVETEVYVLTTSMGHGIITRQLLGHDGYWRRLLREHSAARHFHLVQRNVKVLTDATGAELADVRSSADNAAAADQIMRFVAEHTCDGLPPLHASIAGGRKTMGYLLAAAMMLYGRPQDRLSHVLIYPPELEGTDFFYPPAGDAEALAYRQPSGRRVRARARDIRVERADLPFPRLRAVRDLRELPALTFSALVAQLQSDLDVLTAARVSVQPEQDLVVCGTRGVRLSPARAAIYALLAERRRAGCGRPDCVGCATCFVSSEDVSGWFRERLSALMRARHSAGVGPKWGLQNFLPEVPKINAELRECLRGASAPYEIKMWGRKRARYHGLTLRPDAIEVVWT